MHRGVLLFFKLFLYQPASVGTLSFSWNVCCPLLPAHTFTPFKHQLNPSGRTDQSRFWSHLFYPQLWACPLKQNLFSPYFRRTVQCPVSDAVLTSSAATRTTRLPACRILSNSPILHTVAARSLFAKPMFIFACVYMDLLLYKSGVWTCEALLDAFIMSLWSCRCVVSDSPGY